LLLHPKVHDFQAIHNHVFRLMIWLMLLLHPNLEF
jgi:hypothetical protein